MSVPIGKLSLNDEDEDQPLKCKLCDGLKNIKWRCVECKMKICDKCKIIHSNTRASTSHTIKSFTCNVIDDCVMDIQMEQRMKKWPCKEHPYSTYSLFCKTCNFLVCESYCVPQNHKLHDLCGIDQFIKERYRADGKEVSKTEPELVLARSPSQEDDNCITTMASFRTEHSMITNVLDIQMEQRIKKWPCKEHPYSTYSLFCKTCNFLVCESYCVPQNHKLHDLCGIDQFIKERYRSDGKEVSKTEPELVLARSPSQEDDNCITTMASFRTEHSMIIKVQVIYFLKTVSADTAWIGCTENQVLQKVSLPSKSKGEKDIECLQLDKIEGFEAIDIAVINGDMLLLDHNLKRAFRDNYGQTKIRNIYNLDPLIPTCIHFEQKNKLIWIGLREQGEHFILYPKSTRKIIAISETLQVKKTFEYSARKRLFTFPFQISDIDGQICVLDRTNKTTGRVLSLDSRGHRMWEYETQQQTNACGKPFFPTAMATTESNNIVVLDAANKTLHVLNGAGNMVVIKSMTELGIEQPFAMDIDKTGQLWIGSASDKGSGEMKAKIYVINMSIG